MATQSGIHTSADVISAQTLVSQLADGLGLDELWTEFETILNFWNVERVSITDLLSFRTTLAGEAVVQSVDSGPFERATEFGISVAQGVPLEAAVLGYDRYDWDRRSSFTWKMLRDSSVEQVRTVFQAILHADVRLVTGRVLRRLLDPTPSHNEACWPVYGLWSGDGTIPPPFGFNTFTGTESMFLNMTSDPNVADPVKLAAIKDALDRSGLATKNAVSVEVGITKPFELVFNSISSAPRDNTPAIEAKSLDEDTDDYSDEDRLSVAYQFPDEIEEDSDEIEGEVVDVDVVEDDEHADSAGTATPDAPNSRLSVDPGATPGPLGMGGPAGSGLLSLSDAVEAVSDMRAREAARAARMRELRRR